MAAGVIEPGEVIMFMEKDSSTAAAATDQPDPTDQATIRRRRTLRHTSFSKPRARTVEFIHPQPNPGPGSVEIVDSNSGLGHRNKSSSSDSDSESESKLEEEDEEENKGEVSRRGRRWSAAKLSWKGVTELEGRCPLSPYPFSIAVEYLSRILKAKTSTPNFNFHPNCHKLGITHLSFADDIILFCRGDIESVRILKSALDIFSSTSGLQINSSKSCIIFGGVPQSDQIAISELLNCKIGTLPTKNLGLPIGSKQLSSSDYQPLVSRITTKILSWTARHLSYAGRLQLISSVLFSMQVYWCNSLILPVNVVKQIEGLLRNYLWSGKDSGNSNLVALSSVCEDKDNGGLGIKEILGWNKACISRSIYELDSNTSNLWSDWINAYILKGGSIWSAHATSSCSWSWRAIIAVKDDLLSTTSNTSLSYRFAITPSGKYSTSETYSSLVTTTAPNLSSVRFGASFTSRDAASLLGLPSMNGSPPWGNLSPGVSLTIALANSAATILKPSNTSSFFALSPAPLSTSSCNGLAFPLDITPTMIGLAGLLSTQTTKPYAIN